MIGNRLTARTFLAREIRIAREAKGWSRAKLGKEVFVSESLIAAWENGRYVPKPDVIERLEEKLETKGFLTRLIDDLVSGEVPPEWLGKWVSTEEQSSSLHWYETIVVPGLLQTEDYARAVLRLNKKIPYEIEEQVRARIARQQIFAQDEPPIFVAVISEAVLHHPVGGNKVMREQLHHILELAERPEIIIHVIPFIGGEHAGFAGPFVIASVNGKEVAYVDNALRGEVIEQPDDVATIKRLWDMLRSMALPEKASMELIAKVARNYEMEEGDSQ